jgi:hypothetical protein
MMRIHDIASAVLIGVGATFLIDLWALLLRRVFSIRSLDYCMLGRWALHIPRGVIVHRAIAETPRKRYECPIGWTTHYLIGTGLAFVFLEIVSTNWLDRPTLIPALLFGIATVVIPFFTLQPSLGLGIASSKTPHPNKARLKSLMTHVVFGVGLYLCGSLLVRCS